MDYNLIITEGYTDEVFLIQYLESIGKDIGTKKGNWNICQSGGNDSLHLMESDIKKHNRHNKDTEYRCFIIFDADNNYNNSKETINKFLKDKNLSAKIFLFPNNQDTGDLESLLERIIPIDKQDIIKNCFTDYEKCLDSLKNRPLNPIQTYAPIQKSKIYSYVEVQYESKTQKEKARGTKRDYRDTNIWDLNCDAIKPLLNFLENNVK